MSYDVLEKTYRTLTEEQQAIVYNLVISLGNMNGAVSGPSTAMSEEEKMTLFEKFKGSMKVSADFDAKEAYLESLNERYSV